MTSEAPLILTVGHSNHPFERFVELLQINVVDAVADVRSAPYSRFNPAYNRETLRADLKRHGIDYVFLGRELGARSEDPDCYRDGRVRYELLARTSSFHKGLERVLTGAKSRRVALMCAEKEPLACHRTILVARALTERGAKIGHILADGSMEDHEDTMERLLVVHGLTSSDLFKSRAELIDEACLLQERRIAYATDTEQGEREWVNE